MPVGNSTMNPDDRKVILVSSRKELSKIALRALAHKCFNVNFNDKRVYPLSPLLPLFVRFYTEKILDSWMKTKAKEYKNKSVQELLSEIDEALDLGISLALFEPSDAVRLFKFGVGHTPINGSVYVQHPIIHDAYINPADFSRTVSREKEAAFRQLASSLGAKKLTLINANIETKKGRFGSSVSIPKVAAQIGINVTVDEHGSLIRKVYSEYGKPRREPYVPEDLQPWVDMDADLRTMVRGRINGNLLKDTITLEFKEGMGIGGELAAKLGDRGFSITGSYEAIHHSVWYFDVEYFPIKSK